MSEGELEDIKRNAKDCTPGDVYALVREVERLREWKASVSGVLKSLPEFHTGEWAGDKEGWGYHFEVINWLIRERDRLRATLEQLNSRFVALGYDIAEAYVKRATDPERWALTTDEVKRDIVCHFLPDVDAVLAPVVAQVATALGKGGAS